MKRGGPDGGRDDLSDDRQDETKRRRRDDRDRDRAEASSRRRPSIGDIIFWDRTKGYGFIKCPEETPQDVFFPKGALPPNLQDVKTEELRGIEVMFDFFTNTDGKPRAENISRSGAPPRTGQPPPPPAAPQHEMMGGGDRGTGLLVRYDEAKGYGFITSDDGEELFFLRSMMPPEMAGMRKEEVIDTRVAFEVVTMPDGKLRATNLVRMELPRRGGSAQPRRSSGSSVVKIGRIARYDRNKGYGFIKSHGENEDIFFLPSVLHKDLAASGDIDDMEVEVEFTRNEDGKPRACRVSLPPRNPSRSSGGGSGKIRDGALKEGVIRSFDAQRGFGFLAADGLGEDVFYLRKELPEQMRNAQSREQVVDQRVTFEVLVMPDGKLRAERMRLLTSAASGGGTRLLTGIVRKFDRAKGYGFITVPGEQDDVFFLQSALPKDISEDKVQGMDVSFEFFVNEEGKPRAQRIWRPSHVPPQPPPQFMGMPPPMMMGPSPMGMHGMPPMPPPGMMHHLPMPPYPAMAVPPMAREEPRYRGKVISYDLSKGYGFILAEGLPDDVFFKKSELPSRLRDAQDNGAVQGATLEFEVQATPDGKYRARQIVLAAASKSSRGGSTAGRGRRPATGRIIEYRDGKGYGFIKSNAATENVFFLRSTLPQEYREDESKLHGEVLIGLDVAFELYTNEEGKPRADRVQVISEEEAAAKEGEAIRGVKAEEELQEAADELQLIPEVSDFIVGRGGSCEYDDVAREFPTVPRQVLEQNFDVTDIDGILRIQLLESQEDLAEMDEAPLDEDRDPAIPLGPGCQPVGKIRAYDPAKGFGFIVCPGLDEDIFFPFKALPENFRGRQPSELPSLKDVHVSMDLIPGDRGLRAENVNLLLKWHAGDKCWLLKRS